MAYLKCDGCREREVRLVEMRRDLSGLQERIDKLEPELAATEERMRRLKVERDSYRSKLKEQTQTETEVSLDAWARGAWGSPD